MHVPPTPAQGQDKRGAGHTSVGAKVASLGGHDMGLSQAFFKFVPWHLPASSVLALPERSPLTFAEAERVGATLFGGHIPADRSISPPDA